MRFPILCVISLGLRITGRLNGWQEDPHGPDRGTLLLTTGRLVVPT